MSLKYIIVLRRRRRLRSTGLWSVRGENALMRHGTGQSAGVRSEFPWLRAGFRLRTQTPAKWL